MSDKYKEAIQQIQDITVQVKDGLFTEMEGLMRIQAVITQFDVLDEDGELID